jgi:ribonucleoside-diphosphate reductase alpha chain
MGSAKNVTAFNCFMSGNIADSFTDDDGSIMQRAHEAARTMRMGGGIGYNFSTLRPRGALIKKLMSQSSGPVSFMRIFNEVCLATSSAGHRRGAQMAALRIDHPDIVEYVNAKHDNTSLTGFNTSIQITDAFMESLATGTKFDLKFGGEVYNSIDADELWEMIMRSTFDFAEPGAMFIDTVHRMNNLHYCEELTGSNPCGEIFLPEFGCCLLGSINLPKYLTRQAISVDQLQQGQPATWWHLDEDRIEHDLMTIIPAMDNVIDSSPYPLEQQKAEHASKRRMGIGVMGLANALEALGLPYGSPGFLDREAKLMERIVRACYRASIEIAKTKGSFPLFDADRFSESKFVQSDALDDEIRDGIRRYGIRNSHLMSIAPTGTISQAADNVSGGIEPVFAYSTMRPINSPAGPIVAEIQDYGVKFLGVKGRRCDEVTAKEHVAVATTAQRYVDQAISKTCNVSPDIAWEDFKELYTDAYKAGSKGMTTFNVGGKRMALLTSKDNDSAGATCQIDPTTGNRECS